MEQVSATIAKGREAQTRSREGRTESARSHIRIQAQA
jgi:hypothetical protein